MRSFASLPTPLLLVLFSAFTLPSARGDELKIDVTTTVTCSRPTKDGDLISVNYRGTLQSTGTIFDESYKRGEPITFTLGVGMVIQGWDQGLQNMCPGEARRLTIPPELAYGAWGHPPVIPPSATLIFETELVAIVGVQQDFISTVAASVPSTPSTSTEPAFGIATAPSIPPPTEEESEPEAVEPSPANNPDLVAEPLPTGLEDENEEPGECHLLGPFALIVQGALGAVALLSLVYKRWREVPKRPWKIFFFDVSKQVVGSGLTHALNLAMSMLGSVDMVHAAQNAAAQVSATADNGSGVGGGAGDGERTTPNPCSFYLLNLGIDTTLGIPILYLLLKILHVAFAYTPLARPRESIKSGHYGQPPRATWWLKQCLIYFIGLTGMKLFVLFLFAVLPWLPWVGDWALRWTEGNEFMQIAFTMFIFPLAMNALQYWIIDSFIMEKQGKDGGGSYERVQEGEDDSEDEGETIVEAIDEVRGKDSEETAGMPPTLAEVNATPIPSYDERIGSGSRGASPRSPVGEGVQKADDVDIGEEQQQLRGRR